MTKSKRQPRDPTEQWEQLELLFTSPEQRLYEQIRPVVLFGVPPQERAQEIGAAARTLYRRVQRFAQHGMRRLGDRAGVAQSAHFFGDTGGGGGAESGTCWSAFP